MGDAFKVFQLQMDKSLGKKVPGGPDSSDEDEEDSDDEEEGKRGFSGIKNQSVDEIIAKARFTESFLAGSASIGLTNNLEELAKLGDVEGPGTAGTGGCIHSCYCGHIGFLIKGCMCIWSVMSIC